MTAKTPVTILDGGMGRLLERLGAPFRLPEWSALSLIEAPDYVRRAHQAYVDAGAEIITTNSYGLVPHMLGEERFWKEGRTLADRAGSIARAVADAAPHKVIVAGSLPPIFRKLSAGQVHRGTGAADPSRTGGGAFAACRRLAH